MVVQNFFGVLDYVSVVATLVISLGIGIYHACSGKEKKTSDELLMGSRKMAAVPIAISMLVTYFSAIAIIGYPAEIYSNGIQIFWIHVLLTFICIPLAAFVFMSVMYKLKLTSVYEYLEHRFDSVAVRCLASAIFILQMTLLTGVALFAPSIALEAFLGLPKWISIVGIGVCGTLYTSIGGLKAVVWTDVFQFFLIIVGMLAIVIRGFITAGGIKEAFVKAYDFDRLTLFNFKWDPFERYNTINFIVGYGLTIICFYGAHQPNVQRYSALPTFRGALKAMAWNALLKEVTNILIICAGVSIFSTYAGCDPILLGQIKKPDQIVPYFFINELSFVPGMMGIFTSCIFSAVLSTLSSALNSLAAVTWTDFLERRPYFSNMNNHAKGRVTCLIAAIYGMITIGLAFLASNLGSIFQITITVVGAFFGPLGGCFLMGLFMPCVNKYGAFLGMLCGLFCTSLLTVKAVLLKIPYPTLPTTLDLCPPGTNMSRAINATVTATKIYEYPDKLFTISYILYPFIGSMITFIVGITVSLVTRCFVNKPPESCYDYLHPVIKKCCSLGTSARRRSFDEDNYNSTNISLTMLNGKKLSQKLGYDNPTYETKQN